MARIIALGRCAWLHGGAAPLGYHRGMEEDSVASVLKKQRNTTVEFLAELKRVPSRPNAFVLIRSAQHLLSVIEATIARREDRNV
jgi:hypothetical protein